jgi:hypothetical protein
MKIKLILRPDEFTSFTSHYLEDFWKTYFDIEWYNPRTVYYKSSTVFVVWYANANSAWPKQMREAGYCVAVDNLWEKSIIANDDYYWIQHPNWFWYNESLWWQALGLNQYRPNKQLHYSALMPIRRVDSVRTHIIEILGNLKQQMLWSYGSRCLPNDTESVNEGQRYINPAWYDNTYSSLVIESKQTGPMFITEKTYKPLAFYHPFQIIGPNGILKELKRLGFETYENLFDESYDIIENLNQRLEIIINNLQSIELSDYNALTKEKMQHNHDRFFNNSLVKSHIVTEIIDPLIEHVHANY